MPELPEVETVKNSLKELVLNKKIISVDVYYDRIIQNVPIEYFKKSLINETFVDIKRLGKFLIFIFEKHILLSHLRMEGKYFLKGQEEKGKHEHVIFNLENNETLRYSGTREFGVMYLYDTNEISEVLKQEPLNELGLEPFDEKMTVEYLKGKWAKCKKPIKTSLLDQRVICGLGNIYADEVCFMVKVNPKQETNSLSDSQLQAIIDDSKEVLTKAISLGGTTIKSFVNSHSATGLFQNELLVHTKEVCPNCSGKIEKIVVGGRGTYYCPNCQKLNS